MKWLKNYAELVDGTGKMLKEMTVKCIHLSLHICIDLIVSQYLKKEIF
uniref:Uncharacterized protein n=1 Tax=viral metagenome TaxID=1070528 RepID=A0A6C0JPV2_9ZZZZ